jgi:hypothetical protein
LIRWWLEEDNLTHTPDEMALMMCRLSMLGTGWALGLNLTPEMIPGGVVQRGCAQRVSDEHLRGASHLLKQRFAGEHYDPISSMAL